MKVADFVAEFLNQRGMRHAFVVSGGAIVHAIDAVARHPEMTYVCVQHEQAAGAAADAYWRTNGQVGVVMVTSGPGATNLTTSICNAYFDSIPMLCICGQVTTPRLRPHAQLRQKGFQETDIVSLFSSITKYVYQVLDPLTLKYQLEKALYIAQEGRPGPVVLDIPDDVMRMDIDVGAMVGFKAPMPINANPLPEIKTLIGLIKNAKRPVVIYGAGMRIAKVVDPALSFLRYWGLPALLTWGAKDLMTFDDPLNMGGLGVVGPRAGNFAAQNADVIIAIGTRLSQMITGGKTDLFAPTAKKVLVDIDPYELSKFGAHEVVIDLPIKTNFQEFFKQLKEASLEEPSIDRFAAWRDQIRSWQLKYPICPISKSAIKEYVDGHVLVKEISRQSRPSDVFIGDTGANLAWVLQAIEIKEGQRIFSAWNHTPMGYALSAAVGAAFADRRRIICLTGDGGLMMNIEELATIRRYNLDVKVFIFSNAGHAIQKQTLDTWLNSNYAGVDEPSGLSFPDFLKTAQAFHLPALRASNHMELESIVSKVLTTSGPVVCEVMIDPNQKIEPMLKFGSGLEDLNPKLPVEEIQEMMNVAKKIA